MWEENKNVALGVAKENNGCTSDINNSLPPSLGQEEAKGTCWCWAVPGLKAFHGVQRTLPLEKPSLCTRNIYLRWHPKSTSTALGAQLPTCTPCRMALTHLWHEALVVCCFPCSNREPPNTQGKLFWKELCCGSSGRIMQKQNTPFSLQLRQGVKQKIYFNTQKGC